MSVAGRWKSKTRRSVVDGGGKAFVEAPSSEKRLELGAVVLVGAVVHPHATGVVLQVVNARFQARDRAVVGVAESVGVLSYLVVIVEKSEETAVRDDIKTSAGSVGVRFRWGLSFSGHGGRWGAGRCRGWSGVLGRRWRKRIVW